MNDFDLLNRIDISIVEDNDSLRESLKEILSAEQRFNIMADYQNCDQAFKSEAIYTSDIVFMDISMPGLVDGIEGVRKLIAENPKILIIMLTIHEEDEYIFNAVRFGAVGYLLKNVTPDEIIKAVYDALKGGSPMTPKIARKILKSFNLNDNRDKNTPELSQREKDILNLLACGKSYKTIGKEISISSHTVSYHLRNIYEKLQVKTRTEAVNEAYKKRLL